LKFDVWRSTFGGAVCESSPFGGSQEAKPGNSLTAYERQTLNAKRQTWF
jgi:hypothetical protein